LQIGRPLGDVAPTLEIFRNASLIVLPLVIVLTSYGGWMLAGRALAPMNEIDHTLKAIHASDLSRRVQVRSADAELQRLATTVNETLNRLEQAFVSLRQFAADASHQLQTPLAIMKSSLEFASRRQSVTSEQVIDQLTTDVNDMSATLADLQTLALADAELATTRSGPVDLSEMCQEALEIISVLGEAADITVEAHIQPGVRVWGDVVRLRQLVLNVADNAVKYTPGGGQVRLALTHLDGHAILRVTDTGAGIDAEHLPHIFERFYRADQHPGGIPGTGLGLAIVKRTVDVHRGTIEVSSQLGHGSTFTVTLPLVADA
jgi:signal transduction histidine kinase